MDYGKTYQVQKASQAGIVGGSPINRERERCVEIILQEIEVELKETYNSSSNLADKLSGCLPPAPSCPEQTGQENLMSRLESVLSTIRSSNSQLNRGHQAISG